MKISRNLMLVLFLLLASALSVSSQSNLDCSMYNISEVPSGYVGFINFYQQNDSHAEYGNSSLFNWTIACNSSMTPLSYECDGNFIDVVQLFNSSDAHVSVDGYYNHSSCLRSTNVFREWDLEISAVSATPAEFECLFSIAKMNDSHVYACDNPDAAYNVNLKINSTDSFPPEGSIVIFGPNGTELTNTQNVFLNLSFYDNESGVDVCRWANDNESNLDYAVWESCVSVKPWILSEGTGNKTVYYEIKDGAWNTIRLNDSIVYNPYLDFTPPSAPIVYDGLEGDDIDWWNSNTSISAHWLNATDDISEVYYRYRLLENGSCYDGDCDWSDVGTETSVTVDDLSLKENWVYSFEVQAYNPSNLSAVGVSDGARIDITQPDIPLLNSTTHPNQSAEYTVSDAEFNWTAVDIESNGNMSGVDSYSYLLDSFPGTAPDDLPEERGMDTLVSMRNSGYAQLLRANSTSTSPNTFTVMKQLHTNITAGDELDVSVALAEIVSDYSDLMKVEVYIFKVSDGETITSLAQATDIVSNIDLINRDIKYVESMTLADSYAFDLVINESVDDVSSDIYIFVSGLVSDDDNRNILSIAGTLDAAQIDSSSMKYLCNDSGSCSLATGVDYAIEVKRPEYGGEWKARYDDLSDGIYYFHVKAKDVAGNWGESAHYKITIAAGGVSVSIVYPHDGEIISTASKETNISVKVAVAGNASVYVVAMHPDGSNSTTSAVQFSTTNVFNDVGLELGRNELYAVATTPAGAVTRSSIVRIVVARTLMPESNRTLRVVYDGCAASDNPYLCYSSETGAYVGIGTEEFGGVNVGGGSAQAVTEMNTIKIFMSKPFDVEDAADDLAENSFLDRKSPSFGLGREAKSFVVQGELRYEDVLLSGAEKLAPGKYTVYIINNGLTPDGKINLTMVVK